MLTDITIKTCTMLIGELMYATNRSVYRQLVPGLLVGAIVLFGLMLLGDVTRVGYYFVKFQWLFFGYAVGLTLLNITLRFLKRAICLHKSGVTGVSFKNSLRLFVASFPLAAATNRVGESFKGIWLYKASGIPVERAVSVHLVDNISDVLSVFVLIAIGIWAYPSLWPLFMPLLLLFLFALIFLRMNPRDRKLVGFKDTLPFKNQLVAQVRSARDANPALFTSGSMTIIFLLGILSWAAEGAALFFILAGFGLAPSLALVSTAVLVFAFSTCVGMISTIPGGLGVVELAMAMLLTLLLNFKPEIAVAATILFRLATFWISFLMGILLWSVSGKALGLKGGEGRIIEG
jgi:glycosyltransferase 2 family protein